MAEFKIPTIDDTSRDFEGIRDMMIQLVPFFTPEWTDLNPSDFGVVLIELFAASQDILHFNVDRKLREGFLTTATSRKSVINLLKLIDFELRSAVPAQVDLVFTLGAVQTGPVLIPEGTKVKTVADETTPAVTFETTADLTIPTGDLGDETDLSGNFILTVGAIEGITGTEPVGTSDGTSFQEFTLDAVPIISGTLVILLMRAVEMLFGQVLTLFPELSQLILSIRRKEMKLTKLPFVSEITETEKSRYLFLQLLDNSVQVAARLETSELTQSGLWTIPFSLAVNQLLSRSTTQSRQRAGKKDNRSMKLSASVLSRFVRSGGLSVSKTTKPWQNRKAALRKRG